MKSYLERPQEQAERKQLKQCLEFILEECRMVLPGIQALFGFQLIAVFNEYFHRLPFADQYVHLAAIIFTVGSVALLMGPAAYHRLTSPESLPPQLCKVGTRLVCGGMALLTVSISLEIYLVTKVISESMPASIAFGVTAFVFLALTWFVFPILHAGRGGHHHYGDNSDPTLM